MGTVKDTTPPADQLAEIQATCDRARAGDATALPRLRELMDAHPAIGRHYGDAAGHARYAWAGMISGPDLLLREALLRRAAELRRELVGDDPPPALGLLADRVTVSWLQALHADMFEVKSVEAREGLKLTAFRARRQQQAHRAHLAAIGALVAAKRALGPVPAPAAAPPPPAASDVANRVAGYFGGATSGRGPGRERVKEPAVN